MVTRKHFMNLVKERETDLEMPKPGLKVRNYL